MHPEQLYWALLALTAAPAWTFGHSRVAMLVVLRVLFAIALWWVLSEGLGAPYAVPIAVAADVVLFPAAGYLAMRWAQDHAEAVAMLLFAPLSGVALFQAACGESPLTWWAIFWVACAQAVALAFVRGGPVALVLQAASGALGASERTGASECLST